MHAVIKILLRRFLTATFAGILSVSAASASAQRVVVGVLDTLDPWFYVQMFAPTMERLRASFPDLEFQTVELSSDVLMDRVNNQSLDFFIAPSGFYAFEAGSGGAIHIATRHSRLADDPARSVGSVFVVRASDKRFDSLADLKHATAVAVDRHAFSGYISALGEIGKHTSRPQEFFKNVIFTGYGLPDVTSVLLGQEADVGILPACELERLFETGSVSADSVKIINSKPDKGLACRVSTDLYPDVVFAALPKVSSLLVKDVTVALLTMPASSNGDTWGFASDFAQVNRLYKDLMIGPYEYLRETTVTAFVEKYRAFLLMALTGIVVVIVYIVLVRRVVRIRTAALQVALAETQRAQERERLAREKIFQLEKAGVVGGLSAMFAHEVRQPVASLVNYAGGLRMLLNRQNPDPLVREALFEIETQAEKISQIVDRVRAYARNEERIRVPVTLKSAADNAVQAFYKSSLSKSVTIRCEYTCPEAVVMGDPLELELCLVNILRNAGAALSKVEHKVIRVALSEESNFWMMKIADNGPEISEEKLRELSTPVKSDKPSGLGLGLVICRAIVERHGGQLRFEKVVGGGLGVLVLLPKYIFEEKRL